jgi:hypothetical protein
MTVNDAAARCRIMQRVQYTSDQRAEALRILAEVGLSEAARQTGIPIGTISSWGHRRGVSAPEQPKMAQQAKEAWSVRKVALGEKLGTLCEKMAVKIDERLDEDSLRGVRDLAASIAILVDRAQLLTGSVTQRTEVVERTPENEAEVARVLELVRDTA